MAIMLKCKMCGGDLEIAENATVATCEYCGTQQTVPSADNEKKMTLFARANRLRFGCEFDKAAGVYETIVADFPEEAEAYWGLILCKYGIEYVDDPATAKKIPTCHRSSFDSVMDDNNFELVMEYADAVARKVYRDEAKAIEELRQGIVEVSGKEEPYDIFICYKETDAAGGRTIDSVLAQDVYDTLTDKGYRVFFSRVTLEDKLGQEYEPYIFAALNSAKIMLAFGTDYEHYNAVWVKNEWSRYLQLMAKDKTKHLIPCYKNIDAYDMPKEFAKLQAQDMGKVGAEQDLLRGIEKLLPRTTAQPVIVQQTVAGGTNTAALVDRGNMALEDGDFAKAANFFDQALNIDSKCAAAYLGNFLVETRSESLDGFADRHSAPAQVEAEMVTADIHDVAAEQTLIAAHTVTGYLSANEVKALFAMDATYESAAPTYERLWKEKKALLENKALSRALSYADPTLKKTMEIALTRMNATYASAIDAAKRQSESVVEARKEQYARLLTDAATKAAEMKKAAEEKRESDYQTAVSLYQQQKYPQAQKLFQTEGMAQYKEATAYAKKCKAKQGKRTKTMRIIGAVAAAAVIAVAVVVTQVIVPANKQKAAYKAAEELLFSGDYEAAEIAFAELGDYKDSVDKVEAYRYEQAISMLSAGEWRKAKETFEAIIDYKDSAEQVDECKKIQWNNCEAGDSVFFGNYEQDDATFNGKEEIEWIILEKQDNKLLVLSKYILDYLEYHNERADVSWENSTMRTWLNRPFIKNAFTEEEQNRILSAQVSNNNNQKYDINGGNDTTDKVFLLSIEEASELDSTKLITEETSYSLGRTKGFGRARNNWWLRSPGKQNYYAAQVAGVVSPSGQSVSLCAGVRPAMWVSIEG